MLCYSLRTCMSRKWMWFWPVVRSRPLMMRPQLDTQALSRLAQRRLCLKSPIRQRQTFPNLAQVWMVGRSASLVLDFRLALFSPARVWICSSPALSCLWSVCRAPTAVVSLPCLPSSRCWCPGLSGRGCRHPCSAAGDSLQISCLRQARQTRCPLVCAHLPSGERGHASEAFAIWAACTWWGGHRVQGPALL